MTIATGQTILAADMDVVMPIGSILPFAGRSAPTDFLLCDGSAISRSTYAALFAILCPSGIFTVTIASPAVFSKTGHGLVAGDKISLTTSGALPTGLAAATDYYVISSGLTADAFQVALSPGGVAVNTSGSQSGTHTLYATAWGMGNGSTTFNLPDMRSKVPFGRSASAPTMALVFESAAVNTGTDLVTIIDRVFPSQGQAVVLTTTGSLPTGLSLATTYYIVRPSSTTIGFATSLANAIAGSLVNITGAGSGVHTITFTQTAHPVIGLTGGEDQHSMSVGEMPLHTHTIPTYSVPSPTELTHVQFGDDNLSGTATTDPTGSNFLHNNMPPFAVLNYIIKAVAHA